MGLYIHGILSGLFVKEKTSHQKTIPHARNHRNTEIKIRFFFILTFYIQKIQHINYTNLIFEIKKDKNSCFSTQKS